MPADESADIIHNLLLLIVGRDGKAAQTRKFCQHCEGGLHGAPYHQCGCACHRGWQYLEERRYESPVS